MMLLVIWKQFDSWVEAYKEEMLRISMSNTHISHSVSYLLPAQPEWVAVHRKLLHSTTTLKARKYVPRTETLGYVHVS